MRTSWYQASQVARIAFAYVGIIVGAGLSSGQDIVQYFLSFGSIGLVAVIALGLVNVVFGRIILLLGSFYMSREHTEVLTNIAHPVLVRLIDYALVFSNFVIAFVMIAGAGANLRQQFGLPFTLGALICVILIYMVAHLNFERITQVLGVFTPVLLVMILVLLGASLSKEHLPLETLNQLSRQLPHVFEHPALSVINYYALCAMTGVSMAFVLGGKVLRIGTASKAGALGGALIGLIMFIVAVCLFLNANLIQQSDVPMLTIANSVHPLFADLYTLLIFGLLFNTAFSLDYAMVQRVASRASRTQQHLILLGILLASLALAHIGFTQLVALMYPILGYVGLVLLVLLAVGYARLRKPIMREKRVRRGMLKLFARQLDPNQELSVQDAKRFNAFARASQVETATIKVRVAERVRAYYKAHRPHAPKK